MVSRSKYQQSNDKYRLGKYYTPTNVIDLILAACIKTSADKVLDPACGPGGFLKETLSRLFFGGSNKQDPRLKEQIWGVELDSTSAISTRRDIAGELGISDAKEINILEGDFFNICSPQKKKETLDSWSICSQNVLPFMNVVVGNPPYTRQEELIGLPFEEKYKEKLKKIITQDYPDLRVSKMAGIYIYFLIHASSFLPKDEGRLGFVTFYSWMDTKYGSALKDLLTRYFKIHFIIESDVEKWFPDAQMLPCVIIAEKCKSTERRESNMVKIIRLKHRLSSYLVNINQNMNKWKKMSDFLSFLENAENELNFNTVEFLNKRVHIHDSPKYRILSIMQKELSEDPKWGKYLTAPETFFQVLNAATGMLVPLSSTANVRRGVTTGANDFFLLPNKFFNIEQAKTGLILIERTKERRKFFIESEYVIPLLRSRRQHVSIPLRTSDGYILIVNESKEYLKAKGKRVLEYIEFGESAKVKLRRGLKDSGQYIIGFNNLSTMRSRKNWYSLKPRTPAPIIFPNISWKGYVAFYNEANLKPVNSFFEVYPNKGISTEVLCALLNSTLTALFTEFSGRYIENRDGTRSNQIMLYELNNLPIIDPRRIGPYYSSIEKLFNTILDIEINNNIVNIDEKLRAIDQLIFCNILGFSEKNMDNIRNCVNKIIMNRLEDSDHRFLKEELT